MSIFYLIRTSKERNVVSVSHLNRAASCMHACIKYLNLATLEESKWYFEFRRHIGLFLSQPGNLLQNQ